MIIDDEDKRLIRSDAGIAVERLHAIINECEDENVATSQYIMEKIRTIKSCITFIESCCAEGGYNEKMSDMR